ncbi:MAG: C4-type zinc ribbon domain-containing protein [Myxococcaceae bacterium]
MREKLLALVALQKVDLEIAGLRKSADGFPKQIAELEKELGAARSAMDAEKAKLNDLDRQRMNLEATISEEKDKVKKWEGRLTEQRSTREYSALAREIDIAKKSNLSMGEELVELGKAVATQRTAALAKETDFNTRSKDLGAKMSDLRAKLTEAEAGVKGLEGKRNDAAAGVDKTLLKQYDHVKKKRTPGMAAVVAPGTCTGCRMNVPPQLYNTLRTSLGYDICPSCQRVIYAAEALEAPGANEKK